MRAPHIPPVAPTPLWVYASFGSIYQGLTKTNRSAIPLLVYPGSSSDPPAMRPESPTSAGPRALLPKLPVSPGSHILATKESTLDDIEPRFSAERLSRAISRRRFLQA